MQLCFRIFCIFENTKKGTKKGSYFFVFLKVQIFSLELRTGKTHRPILLTTSETWSGYPTTTRGCSKRQGGQLPIPPISMRIKWQMYANIACSFSILKGCIFEKYKCQSICFNIQLVNLCSPVLFFVFYIFSNILWLIVPGTGNQ